MANSNIPVTPGAGANVDTFTMASGDHREAVVLGDATADNVAKVSATGELAVAIAANGYAARIGVDGNLQVAGPPSAMLTDTFEALDPLKWTLGGTISPTASVGVASVSAGTANSASSSLVSVAAFGSAGAGFNILGGLITAETAQLTNPNIHRFFGFGVASSFTALTPVTDGVGVEFALDGAMQCVVYVGGTRYVAASTTAANVSVSAGTGGSGTAIPAEASIVTLAAPPTWGLGRHRVGILYRPDMVAWIIDGTSPIALAMYLAPNVSTLPVRITGVTATSGTVLSTTYNVSALAVLDSTAQSHWLSDGTYPWRKAQVGKSGGLAVRGATIAGVSAPFAATVTGTAGPLDVSEAGNVTIIAKSTIPGSAYAGAPVLVFEQSDDNVSWAAMAVVRSDTQSSLSTHVLGPGVANGEIMFSAPLLGTNWVRVRLTTAATTNGITITIQPGGMGFQPMVTPSNPARSPVTYYALIPVLATATDVLMSLTGTKAGATVTAATAPAVTSPGKQFRITSFAASYIATATSGHAVVRLRANLVGAVAITSPVYRVLHVGAGTPATAGSSNGSRVASMSDGLEFPAGTGVGISVQGFAAATPTAVGYVIAELSGYEY